MSRKLFCYIILVLIIAISIFFFPTLYSIYKWNIKIKDINILIETSNIQMNEITLSFNELNNKSNEFAKIRDDESWKMKLIMDRNSLFENGINEGNNDLYLIERRIEEYKSYIDFFESNNLTSEKKINELNEYFKENSIKNYLNNKNNILVVSSILKIQDLDFIYKEIIKSFYGKEEYEKYILGPPCYKATIDGNIPSTFHKNCDNVGDTIMFIKTEDTRFGGITDFSWDREKDRQFHNTKTKIFNLDTQKIFSYNSNNAMGHRYITPIQSANYYLASFGYSDIFLGIDPKKSSSKFPNFFQKNSETEEDFNDLLNQKNRNFVINNNEIKFEYKDIEVYPIINKGKFYK